MKLKKIIKRYCKFCKKQTEQTVSQVKNRGLNATHHLTHGSKIRANIRGRSKGKGNLGRYSRKAISAWKRTGVKASKKINIKYTCKECKKSVPQAKGKRAKKLEII